MSTTMKAVVVKVAGPPEVLVYTDVEKPHIQRTTDALVRIVTAGVNPGDCQIRRAGPRSYTAGDAPHRTAFSVWTASASWRPSEPTSFRPGDEVWYYDGGYANHQFSYAQFKVTDARYPALLDQRHRLKIELAAELPSRFYKSPPVSSITLTECL